MEGVEMKQVTLAELAEMAKNDKVLEQKILEGSKKIREGVVQRRAENTGF